MAHDPLSLTSVIRSRSSCSVDGGVSMHSLFDASPQKKSNEFRVGDRSGHSTQPPYVMTCCWNAPQMYCYTGDALCGETPSC
ncbi:uncharacterized protein TNCV_1552251 [Trichonephila clavipes]|nr:uncharacterized protein TNCV_1552251 [Trichonephila clavipes]